MTHLSQALFRKATATNENPSTCVQVARQGDIVEIWDDKKDFTPENRMTFTAEQFDMFQLGVREGKTDGLCIAITRRADGINEFRSTVPQAHDGVLEFDDAEVEAFFDGVRKHEFDMDAFAKSVAV